jgi:hypothetical protein
MGDQDRAQPEASTNALSDLLSPSDFERLGGPKEATQAVWRSANRYGFRDLAIHVGRNIRYRRSDLEAWLSSRKGLIAKSSEGGK